MILPNTSNPLLSFLGETQPQKSSEQSFVPSFASYNRDEVIELCRTNLNFFASLALPTVVEFDFPPLFHAVWELITSKAKLNVSFTRLAVGLPRGFAKTTLMKLVALWCILFTNKKSYLIIGAVAARAENILSDLADMLDEPNIRATFGDWKLNVEKDTQGEKVFGFRGKSITLVALGAGGSLRGINIKNARPDFILMDDMQSRENAQSPVLSNQLLEWMFGTLIKTKSPKCCLFLFVGNMYPFPGSILRNLRKNPTWISLIVGALLADGESIWPELRSREDLLDEFQTDLAAGKPELFLSEVLNDENAANTSSVDITRIPKEPIGLADALPQGSFIVIDPSGKKSGSDNTAIGHFSIYDMTPLLDELEEEIMTPMQTIKQALTMALKHNCKLIAVESVAYQASLLYWFEFIGEQLGVSGIDFVEIYPGSVPKNSRIKSMLGQLIATETKDAEILIADALRSRVLNQVTQWNPLRRDNVDEILDLLWYAPQVMINYGHLAAIRSDIDNEMFAGAKVLTLAENSRF